MGRDKDAASRRSLDRAFSRHLKGEGVEVSRLPDEMKDERTWAVLRFAYPDGDLLDLLVDAATGASTWTREMTDGREQWTRASDLREVGGVRLAFRQETLNEVALQNQTVTWTSAAVNTGLADDLFHRPGAHTATKLFRLPAGVTATSWLPPMWVCARRGPPCRWRARPCMRGSTPMRPHWSGSPCSAVQPSKFE